jgi:hypothetical protein
MFPGRVIVWPGRTRLPEARRISKPECPTSPLRLPPRRPVKSINPPQLLAATPERSYLCGRAELPASRSLLIRHLRLASPRLSERQQPPLRAPFAELYYTGRPGSPAAAARSQATQGGLVSVNLWGGEGHPRAEHSPGTDWGAARPTMSSSRFSPALQASDLNDFIAPSQDCIISLNKNTSSSSRRPQVLAQLSPPGFVVYPSIRVRGECWLGAVWVHSPYLFRTLIWCYVRPLDIASSDDQKSHVHLSRARTHTKSPHVHFVMPRWSSVGIKDTKYLDLKVLQWNVSLILSPLFLPNLSRTTPLLVTE